ncbi:MAG: hypothetical protein IJO34_03400 [Akkermansia sp.]|nr:hypothetical protein [Akkermansia sp.]
MTNTYIRNATWVLDGKQYDFCLGQDSDAYCELSGICLPGIERIAAAGELEIPAVAPRVHDATGKILMPALFDMHAGIEIEGRSKRECVSRAGQAAISGGVWGMLVMPSAGFCFDNAATLDSFHDAVTQRSAAEMLTAGCISQGMQGEQQALYNTLAARGVSILSDGEKTPGSLLMLHRAMKYASEIGLTFALRGDVPALTANTCIQPGTTSYKLGLHGTPPCAEEIGIDTALRLAADAGAKVHVQTVSTAGGVDIIRRAKAAGQPVTAEVALHHLLFTHENVGDYDTTYKTLPPLRDASDCEALLEGLRDGTIDCIVTNHTPCTPFAKKQDFTSAPQGMIVLDTFLQAIYTHLIKPGKLSWADVVRTCCINPVNIATPTDLEEDVPTVAPLLLFDPESSFTVGADALPSGTLNTPFLGTQLHGRITLPLQ